MNLFDASKRFEQAKDKFVKQSTTMPPKKLSFTKTQLQAETGLSDEDFHQIWDIAIKSNYLVNAGAGKWKFA